MVAEGESAGRGYTAKVAGLTAPAPITAAPVQLNYSKPAIQTYSPQSGWGQVAGTNSSYSNMAQPGSFQSWSAPTKQWVNPTPAPAQQSFAPAPAQQMAPMAPPEPPRPQFAPGGRKEFMQLSPEQQQMAQDKYLGGDSDYTEQVGLYQKALDDFVKRIAGKIGTFEQDATDATNSNIKNEGMSVDNLGADFGARGLSYSGLFTQARDKTKDRFSEGRVNITKNKNTNVQNAKNDQADYEAETEINKKNAQRASLLRMAQQQQLLDANY